MYPYFHVIWDGTEWVLAAQSVLILLFSIFAFLSWIIVFGRELRLRHLLSLFALGFLATWYGARFFHVFFERPGHFSQLRFGEAISEVFLDGDGMTFYGGFILGVAVIDSYMRRMLPRGIRLKVLDFVTLVTALGYGVLRIGCFLNGCCWGKLTALPWAVVYRDSNSYMPELGVPVHPVQLYDSLLGLTLFGFLLRIRYKQGEGRLFPWFLVLMGAGRFVTEMFRGDLYRGASVALGLSTSQWISLLMLLVGSAIFLRARSAWLSPKFKQAAVMLCAAVLLGGCLTPPEPPSSEIALKVGTLPQGAEIYQFPRRWRRPKKTLVWVAAEDQIQKYYVSLAAQYYPHAEAAPRVEELTWWYEAPVLGNLYEQVLVIPYAQTRWSALHEALEYAEHLGGTYDLFLLTHGLKNNPVILENTPWISWEDIDTLKGALPNLGLVLMQSCYGQSVAHDWFEAGAKAVISYPEEHENYLYPLSFVDAYAFEQGDVFAAFQRARRTLGPYVLSRPLLRRILKLKFDHVQRYLRTVNYPVLERARDAK